MLRGINTFMKKPVKPDLKDPVHFLAFGFGSGLSPWAPGTAGTLAAIPIALVLLELPLLNYLAVVIVVSVAGIWICGNSSEKLGVHDHGGIVWDEIVGYLVTMIAVPASWQTLLAGFVLFRAFDIIKPWPISWLDKKVSGGFGIMIDDIIAGIFSAVVLHLLLMYDLLVI